MEPTKIPWRPLLFLAAALIAALTATQAPVTCGFTVERFEGYLEQADPD